MARLLGGGKKEVVSAIPEPTIMPLPDDDAMRLKKKKSLSEQQKRGGRSSTILSTDDKLGS